MYFRKTVHCWCVGSSWIDLPLRVFINCLFTLEKPQAILKFKKVSDIVIAIAGLEFVSVRQYSLHFGNIVSAVQNHHTVALVGFFTNFTNFNSVHRNIVFSKELETNNCLHFLDVSIEKTSTGFITSTYRKPTHTGLLEMVEFRSVAQETKPCQLSTPPRL